MDARISEASLPVKAVERAAPALTIVPPPDSQNPAAVYLAALAP